MKHIISSVMLLTCINACTEAPDHSAFGTLERDRITLSAPATELITELYVKKGQQVKQGELLLQLDQSHQQQQVIHAKAQLDMQAAALQLLKSGSRDEQIAAALAQVRSV